MKVQVLFNLGMIVLSLSLFMCEGLLVWRAIDHGRYGAAAFNFMMGNLFLISFYDALVGLRGGTCN